MHKERFTAADLRNEQFDCLAEVVWVPRAITTTTLPYIFLDTCQGLPSYSPPLLEVVNTYV